MSLVNFTWDCKSWLYNNYTTTNGLPGFFHKGCYSYTNKTLAELEYRLAVTLATSSDDAHFSQWANNILKTEFSVLKNTNVKSFWSGLLASEARQQQLDQYNEMQLASSSLPTPVAPTSPPKRPSAPPPEQRSVRPRIDFNESDGIYIGNMNISIGTFVGQLARNARSPKEQKPKYFHTIGMNGIIDCADDTSGSQLDELLQYLNNMDDEASYDPNDLKDLLAPLRCTVTMPRSHIVPRYQSLIASKIVNRREPDEKQLKKWYHTIRSNRMKADKHERYFDSFMHILKLHMYSSALFRNEATLSEQDFVVKIWSVLIESLFRKTNINPHWGDTVPAVVLNAGAKMKLDLRLLDDLNERPDYACGEFAKEVFSCKYYKDKRKAVLAAKAHMNEYFACNNIDLQDIPNFKYPFILITGFEMALFYLRIVQPGLYVLDSVEHAWFPTTVGQIKDGAICNVVNLLDCFVDMCLVVKKHQGIKADTHRVNKRKSMTDLTNDTSSRIATTFDPAVNLTDSSATAATKWTRSLWIPNLLEI